MAEAMPEGVFKKYRDTLWPLGGTVLGLLVVPIFIAQYPDFFNENRWIFPVSVVIVGICWLIPLLLHERAQRTYDSLASVPRIGPILAPVLLVTLFLALIYFGV